MVRVIALLVLVVAVASATPDAEELLGKLGLDLPLEDLVEDEARPKLLDALSRFIDIDSLPIYIPSRDNEFHLFTRANPTVSQPLILDNPGLLLNTNFSPNRRTVVLIHGHGGSPLSNFNLVLIPAFLSAADVNVILVDWSDGAQSSTLFSLINISLSSRNVRNFINFVSQTSGQSLADFHLVGFGLGALQAGLIGRRLNRQIGYITALEPAFGSVIHELLPQFRRNDAIYTEVVHTNVGNLGYIKPMGQVDFYPNGGINMPGCGRDDNCDHERAYHYFAETLTSGGFTGSQCSNHEEALLEECSGPTTLNMGGVQPKTGASGIYSVPTNAGPPFSQG